MIWYEKAPKYTRDALKGLGFIFSLPFDRQPVRVWNLSSPDIEQQIDLMVWKSLKYKDVLPTIDYSLPTDLVLLFKYFDLVRLHNQVGKFTFETSSFHDVVVDPVVVSTPRLVHQKGVVFEIVFFQPFLGDFPVFLGSGGKEGNNVTFIVPLVQDLEGVRVG